MCVHCMRARCLRCVCALYEGKVCMCMCIVLWQGVLCAWALLNQGVCVCILCVYVLYEGRGCECMCYV